jgi:arylsulfatase A-like enzyme
VTPNLDRMAADGLYFTHGYSNSPVCSPTRFALATGRYQYRLRGAAEEPIAGGAKGNPILGLPPEHPTLPSLLRDAGYASALIGKWHLGFAPHFGPLKSGYDYFFGPFAGGVDYFTHCSRGGEHDLWENESEVHRTGYLTDLLSARAEQFVATSAREEAFPAVAALHRAALAVGDARRRGRIEAHRRRDRAHRRRLDPHSTGDDPSHGRGHRHDPVASARDRRSIATRWSSSPATTAASASPTTGPSSASRWT